MLTTNIILTILTSAIVIAIGVAAAWKVLSMVDQRARREREMELRMAQLEEELNRKRHTQPTLHGMFDADALAVRGWKEVEENLLPRLEMLLSIFRTISMILGETSESPTSYQDRPAQEWEVRQSESGTWRVKQK